MRQICDSSIGADTIPIIHGLRSISMGWVILGHTCIVAFKYSGMYQRQSQRSIWPILFIEIDQFFSIR